MNTWRFILLDAVLGFPSNGRAQSFSERYRQVQVVLERGQFGR